MTLVFYTRMKVILRILGLIYLIFKDFQMRVVQNHFALTLFRQIPPRLSNISRCRLFDMASINNRPNCLLRNSITQHHGIHTSQPPLRLRRS